MTQKQTIFNMIYGQWRSALDFTNEAKIMQYNARIHEIRKDGFTVEKKKGTNGVYYYRIPAKTQGELNLL